MASSHSVRNQRIVMSLGIALVVIVLLYCLVGTVYSGAVRRSHPARFDSSKKDTLQLLHIVFRHGARTPADTYPLDPYVNETFYPNGWGQVTNSGKDKLYKMGIWMHDRYGKFLGEYTPDSVHAQATGVSRTHVSMQTVLAGLYRPRGSALDWNRSLNWLPIPVYSQTLEEDSLLLVRTPCPRYYEARDDVYNLPEIDAAHKKYEEMMKELSDHTGKHIANAEDVADVFTTLLAEKEFGLTLPDWTKSFYPKKMQELTDLSYLINVYTEEMQRIKGGPFLKKMVNEMVQKANSTLKPADRKLYIYTGHDSTVVNILMALKVWPNEFPNYAIQAYFELHKSKEGNYYVEIYMRNAVKGEPVPLTLPGCDFKCPLDKLIELTKPVIPENWEEVCKAKDTSYTEPPPSGP
ncbi:hypothetical protein ACFFRR_003323 [Megaselia abdita]